ncbi:hypothetical protein LTR36_002353 [Oleoguttula mirabilis]|uniref:Uncharacterized protein n=1 Tax=Oleoguttula mirabilis TaxID=1507867 RepID=A0AAV9JLI6_9PEZI|nr:hypothetical protein LTR36_002353 [Oleoguttula mirabilis]
MASTTATATRAAAGFDKRTSSSSSLQTPGSGTFPSELRSPLAGSPGFMKQRDSDLKTPITPPLAYLDFLKNMSPAMMSPAPTSTSARFSFNEKSFDKSSEKASQTSTEKPSISPPTSQPALSRNASYDSTASSASSSSVGSAVSSVSAASTIKMRPESPRVTIPPSAFAKPAPRSARTPRRLHIPQSPFSPVPASAHSVASPYVSTPLSSAPWSASFESHDANPEAHGPPGKVSVKQVVTRTVTYCRTPLEPAPNGNLWKRRKVEHEETTSCVPLLDAPVTEETASKMPLLEASVKAEKQEDTTAGPSIATAGPSHDTKGAEDA